MFVTMYRHLILATKHAIILVAVRHSPCFSKRKIKFALLNYKKSRDNHLVNGANLNLGNTRCFTLHEQSVLKCSQILSLKVVL